MVVHHNRLKNYYIRENESIDVSWVDRLNVSLDWRVTGIVSEQRQVAEDSESMT